MSVPASGSTPATGQPRLVYAVAATSALGGLLFGYDTGIISSALLFLSRDFDLSSRQQEIVVSAILVGAMVGALGGGALSNRLGRRRIVAAVAVVFGVGAIAAALAPDTGSLIAARFVLGLSVGGASAMVPVYIAEMAPPGIRGRLMVLFQLMVAIGQLVAYVCGYLLAGSGGWRWMFALAVVPAVVLALGMTRLPESPRWLVEAGRVEEARRVLARLRRPEDDVDAEIAGIHAVQDRLPTNPWKELRKGWIRPALVAALGIAMFSQLTGINAVVYYAPTVLTDAGFGDSVALLTGIGIGVMLVAAGIAGTLLLDRVGRRRILLLLMPGSAIAMGVLALSFLPEQTSTAQQWVIVGALFAYIGLNGVSMQSVVWLLGPEILPLAVRGPATSLAALTLWGFDLLIAVTALSAVNSIGRTATFGLYALMNVLCIVFVVRYVPEPKGRSLEQVEQALRRPGRFVDNVAAADVPVRDAEDTGQAARR
ncbi:sugar porter family MFS transporter [Kineococcus rhizosphaerae]|uniref:Sugar porter (SP) family MFS transporter n=1 Tax=Kineococcus rhizosphaerae TaxID=559628 RepID=A0A2T0QZN4_9ACTN|nr:sugar porter family MFS transporter [Kineococcus rhizosphaerae]PRY12156.1 sugar porter (SP) family MFS transporter [Kineococcus rhizosphaerae]